ncbi:29528_t:CDS:2, partial [Racocetra persica]
IEALSQGLKERKSHETYQEKLFKITQWYDKQNEETQRTYTQDLDKRETRHIKNLEDNAEIEILTNQKRLDIVARQKKQEDKTKRKQIERKTYKATTSSVSEASSSWNDDSAIEDAKFQDQHDKFTKQNLENRDLKDLT